MKKGNRLRRTALVLALLVLAGICTGVAASATKTAVPKQLTGWWKRPAAGVAMHVNPGGKVEINFLDGTRPFHPKFSRVTTHRLSISGIRSCSGTGTYRWKVANRKLTLTKIHDACEPRVGWFDGSIWSRHIG